MMLKLALFVALLFTIVYAGKANCSFSAEDSKLQKLIKMFRYAHHENPLLQILMACYYLWWIVGVIL